MLFRSIDQQPLRDKKVLFFSLILFFILACNVSAAGQPAYVQLKDSWSYAVGDYQPGKDSTFEWLPLKNLASMPVNEDNKVTPLVTYRYELPDVECRDCVIAIPNYTRAYAVHVGDEYIAKAGPGTALETYPTGKPEWLIKLPGISNGKVLHLTVNLYYRSAKPYDPIYYGEREAIVFEQFKTDRIQIVISLLILMTGLISTMLYFSLRRDVAYLYLGLAASNIGIYMFSGPVYIDYLIHAPALLDWGTYISLYFIPITIWLYFRNFIEYNPWFNRILLGTNAAFVAFVFIRMASGFPPFEYVAWSRYLFLLSALAILTVLIRTAWNGNREARMIVVTFIITSLITMSRLVLLIFNIESTSLTAYAGAFFMLSQLFVMTERFRRLNEEMSIHTKNLERFNEVMEVEVKARTKQVRTILDHVSQGFMNIRPDLTVDKEHSAACVNLLGFSPAGHHVVKMIAGENEQLAAWLERMFRDLFNTNQQYVIDMYIQLLPPEMVLNGKTLGLSIEVVRQPDEKPESVILMINDLTRQRALENKLKNEEQLMRMVVTILSRSREYQELCDDYLQFANHDWQQLLDTATEENGADKMALRVIHTFKGNFAQMNSIILAKQLHEYESAVRKDEIETIDQWRDRVNYFEWLAPFEEEKQRMYEVLPESNWNQNKDAIPVPRETLIALRKHIMNSLPPSQSVELVLEIEKLYQKSFSSLFESVVDNTAQLANRLEKMVAPVQIEGGGWFVDLEPWYEWSKSLIHITRNQLDHGIETPDNRIDNGKDVAGLIKVSLEMTESHVNIILSDDGAGINAAKLRKKLFSSGIITAEQSASLSDEQLYPYLFMDAVSTRDQVTELSGRGVGLAKVLEETEKLGGKVRIESELGVGTSFYFSFPAKQGVPLAASGIENAS